MTIEQIEVLQSIVSASSPWPSDGRPRTALEKLDWFSSPEKRRAVQMLIGHGYLEKHFLTSVFILDPAFELLDSLRRQSDLPQS